MSDIPKMNNGEPIDIKIAIMKIGVTPSNYDPKWNGKVTVKPRCILGLPETEDTMIRVVFPHVQEGVDEYIVTSMTLDELKKVGKDFKTTRPLDGGVYNLVWNDEFKQSNEDFFKECAAAGVTEEGEENHEAPVISLG